MSKIAKEKAMLMYPIDETRLIPGPFVDLENPSCDNNVYRREGFVKGYEQAEKDTIEKATKWIRAHWREYIWGPDADGCIGFGLWENDFRKAMEEDNG